MNATKLFSLGLLAAVGISAQETININMTGNVLDARTGAPIAGATVTLGNFPNLRAVTEANGDFRLSGSVVGLRVPAGLAEAPVSAETVDLLGRAALSPRLPVLYLQRTRNGKAHPALRLAKSASDVIDTLKVSKAGFRAATKLITMYNTIFPLLLTPKLPAGDLKIYSERTMGQVAWGSNVEVQVWDGNTQLKGDYPVGFEGKSSWMVDFGPYQANSAWGFVSNAATPEDLSDWTGGTLHVAVKGTVPELAVTVASADQAQGASVKVDLSTLGYLPDNKWHEVSVPLASFVGTDLSRVTIYCGFVIPTPAENAPPFNSLFYQFDDLYYKLKN